MNTFSSRRKFPQFGDGLHSKDTRSAEVMHDGGLTENLTLYKQKTSKINEGLASRLRHLPLASRMGPVLTKFFPELLGTAFDVQSD